MLTDVNMLLIVEKSARGGMYHAIHWHAKANNKNMKQYDPSKESSYLIYWDVNNLCGWAMCSQMVSNGETINLATTMSSYKVMMKTATKEASLKLMLFILRNYKRHTLAYHSYPKKWRLISIRNRWAICITRKFLIHVKVLKQKLDKGVILKKIHRVIEFWIQNSEQKPNMILRRTSSKW